MSEKKKGLFDNFKLFEYKDLIKIELKEFELDGTEDYIFDESRIMCAFPAQEDAILKELEGYKKISISLYHFKQIMKYFKTSKKNLKVLDLYFNENNPLLVQDDKLLFGLAPRVEETDFYEKEEDDI